ncbi:hypothetical protein TUM3792_32250 [Shewanella sp. MBTL60-007]|nr:hypothetical protein TUM3792_32250 [Shewanella sp. MBTL60-007]
MRQTLLYSVLITASTALMITCIVMYPKYRELYEIEKFCNSLHLEKESKSNDSFWDRALKGKSAENKMLQYQRCILKLKKVI